MLLEVAIPFKWGQVFQLFKEEKMVERELEVAIPFKWGQVFQHLRGGKMTEVERGRNPF